jgi:predicted MFS family arabinose efflux permease
MQHDKRRMMNAMIVGSMNAMIVGSPLGAVE